MVSRIVVRIDELNSLGTLRSRSVQEWERVMVPQETENGIVILSLRILHFTLHASINTYYHPLILTIS